MVARPLIWVTAAAILIAGAIAWLAFSSPSTTAAVLEGKQMYIYKSLSCGCCQLYANYADDRGLTVNTMNREMASIKEQYGIPAALQSCHTSMIDGYFIEGHVPLEAVAKLVEEKPDIAGIAMPGMPSGSPGMPGSKQVPFVIYAVQKDGTSAEYMRI